MTNVDRQPIHCAATASGVPASTTPSMLRLNTQLIAVAQRARGYQREHRTTTDMKLPPNPRPSRNRAAISSLPSRTVACHSRPGNAEPGENADRPAHADAIEHDADRHLRRQQREEEDRVGEPQCFGA